MSKLTILYKDVAPGSDAASVSFTEGASDFSEPETLTDGVTPGPAITCEQNAWVLDGTFDTYEEEPIPYWSEEISDGDDGRQLPDDLNKPEITIVLHGGNFSSVGIGFEFGGDSWPCEVTIRWYQGDTQIAEETFYPDGLSFLCEKEVEAYDMVSMEFQNMSLPGRRLKINQIMFGLYRNFDMSSIRDATIVNETGLISLEVPVSTLSFTLDDDSDVAFMFQLKQPMEVRSGDDLLGVYYIDEFSRKSATVYSLSCYDALGVLSETSFSGGVYTDKSAMALLEEIVDGDFDLEFDDVEDMTLTGVISSGTKREAMQQVLFAWGMCASTDGRDSIRIFCPETDPVEIGESRTFNGVTVDTSAIVTKVTVTAHTYTASENGSVKIGGVTYEDTQETYTVTNPNVTTSDKENAVEVTDATLVSPDIVQAVAQRVYDYYLKRNTTKAKAVWQGERVGDCVTFPNAWAGTQTGNVQRMELKLSNKVLASMEVLGT